MKAKALFLLLFLIASISTFAKEGKLKFGKYIYYIGNIENKEMSGKGTLYINNKVNVDEISGTFENNKIASCSIKFGSGWYYKGEAEFYISEKENELKLFLNKGILITEQGHQISGFENLSYLRKGGFGVEFNSNNKFIVEINNYTLTYEIESVLFHDGTNKGSLTSRKINETGKFHGVVTIDANTRAPFSWDYKIYRGRFTTSNGNYYDIMDYQDSKRCRFKNILIKEPNGDYILYGGPNSPLQDNCGRYVEKIRKTLTDSIILEGNRKWYNQYSPYIFEGKVLFADNEYFEGEFKLNCGTYDKFEIFLNNLKESNISFKEGKYHYNNNVEIWKNREFIRPSKIIKAGEKLSFNIDKPGTILSYLPLNKLDKIDSLTITGFLFETDVAVINKCKYLRYLDLSRTFIMYSPQAKKQQINEVKAAIAILKFAGMDADLKYNDGDISSMEYIITKAMTELGNLADEHIDEAEQIKQANEDCIIPESAFKNMKFLKTVKLPITAIAIKERAFYQCESIEYVELPPYLKSISKEAFANCINIKNLDFPPTITEIEEGAFQGCTSIKKVDLSKNKLSSRDKSLYNGTDKVVRLHHNAISYLCYNKNSTIYFPPTLEQIGGEITNCELHFSSPTPPQFDNRISFGYKLQDNKIYVPKGSMTAYFVALGEKNTYIEK